MKSSRSIAIDFGNTRTKVAYFDSVRERSVLIEGLGKQVRAILPSLFYVEETDPPEQCPKEQLVSVSEGGEGFERRVFIGDQAQDKSQADPRGFIHRVKIDIHKPGPVRIRGRQKVDRVGLAACLFAHIKEFCEKKVFHGESIERCRLTVPADYPIAKRDKLIEAAKKAGFQACEVLSEPEAAAKHWLQSKGGDQGKYVIVCDVGGGTTDFAILGRENDQFVKYSEVAPRSIEQGGLHVDEAIWETFLETLLDNYDQEESYWRSISPIWLVWIRGVRENDDRPASGVCTFQNEDMKLDLEWETIRKAEDSFNADIAGELKRFTEQCAEATGEEQIPVLLAGGGSCMPNLKETLEKAVLGEVHVWNDSEYATVLGAVERVEKAVALPEETEQEQETPETIAQEESSSTHQPKVVEHLPPTLENTQQPMPQEFPPQLATQALPGTHEVNPNLIYPKPNPSSPHLCWLNLLCLWGLAHLIFGQVAKGLCFLCLCILLGLSGIGLILIIPLEIFLIIDSYKVGKTLAAGKPVGKWEFFPSP